MNRNLNSSRYYLYLRTKALPAAPPTCWKMVETNVKLVIKNSSWLYIVTSLRLGNWFFSKWNLIELWQNDIFYFCLKSINYLWDRKFKFVTSNIIWRIKYRKYVVRYCLDSSWHNASNFARDSTFDVNVSILFGRNSSWKYMWCEEVRGKSFWSIINVCSCVYVRVDLDQYLGEAIHNPFLL